MLQENVRNFNKNLRKPLVGCVCVCMLINVWPTVTNQNKYSGCIRW